MRQKAEKDKIEPFNNLFHFLKVDLLRKSFYELKRKAAAGLDGVSWYEYKWMQEARLPELERELHIGSYRVAPAKRIYITKESSAEKSTGYLIVILQGSSTICRTINS